jgi:hypothetical protein
MIKSVTESKAMRRKLEIQTIAEKILVKHGIDTSKDFYMKLSLLPYQDLIMERNGDIVLIGHYRKENGDLISDPVLVFDYNQGYWYPMDIEQWCSDTVCSYVEDGKRMIYPEKIKEFRSFQRMFSQNIKEQGWLDKGNPIQEAIVCDVFFISKDAPNPFVLGNCLSDYSDPRDE